ncbi:MAG TPA: M13 family metallopeptidase [Steroidobacteraceae bacterium]|nr:M13 family metallopeptidase [Steroidobacteraceae bacterium]
MPTSTTGIRGALTLVLACALTPSAAISAATTEPQPGDDFFAYANSAWLQATKIPDGAPRWTARSEINDLTRRQLDKLVDDTAGAPADSNARKVANFRAAYLDDEAIESDGVTPLAPTLGRINAISDRTALTRFLGSELRADVDPLNLGIYDSTHLLGLSVEPGLHGEANNVALLLQGGLGLGDRDRYLSTAADDQSQRTRYERYIGRMLALAGFDQAEQRAAGVMALEIAIARTHATSAASADEANASNLWTRADFARQAPGMDWSAFFAAAKLSKQQSFVVWQPGAVTGAAALVASQPLAAWLDYLRFHVIHAHVDVLPHAFADEALNQSGPREQRALTTTQQAMSGILGQLYAERHFPPQQKARVQAIAANVIAAFRQRVAAVTWLSPASKKQALAKLKTVYFGMGYPEKWQDYSDLKIDAADPIGNQQRLVDWNYERALARVGKPVDLTQWWISPQTAGAVLLFQQNAYNFSAALLQAPKFDATASDAMNYGAIGAIIGHEASHFVDTLGADYDASRRKLHWWTAEDMAGYEAATRPLVEQFSSYRPLPDMTIDGKRTLVENVADLGGLAAAFDAYRHTLGSKASDKQYVKQLDREFFIGFARAWRSKTRQEALREQLTTDSHAPETFRIATVRNLDAWYEAFDVKPGQTLYLEPEARVRIW